MLSFDNCINVLKYDNNKCFKVVKGKLIKKIQLPFTFHYKMNLMCLKKRGFIGLCVDVNKCTHNCWDWYLYINCEKMHAQFNENFSPLKYAEPSCKIVPLQLMAKGARDFYLTGSKDSKRQNRLEQMKQRMKQKINKKKVKKENYWGAA